MCKCEMCIYQAGQRIKTKLYGQPVGEQTGQIVRRLPDFEGYIVYLIKFDQPVTVGEIELQEMQITHDELRAWPMRSEPREQADDQIDPEQLRQRLQDIIIDPWVSHEQWLARQEEAEQQQAEQDRWW